MIIKNEPLSISEVMGYLKKKKDEESDVAGFIKKFSTLDLKDAQTLKKKLEDLELMKLKIEHIVKIIDFMPEDAEELNKIFIGINLDEDETKKILETVKEFK